MQGSGARGQRFGCGTWWEMTNERRIWMMYYKEDWWGSWICSIYIYIVCVVYSRIFEQLARELIVSCDKSQRSAVTTQISCGSRFYIHGVRVT